LSIVCALIFQFTSCKDDDIIKNEPPSISFVKYELLKDQNQKDSILIITFSFEDANGDLGLSRSDTLPPFNPGSIYQFNLWVDMYNLDAAEPEILTRKGTTEPLNLNQRIPNLTPDGKNKEISGEIRVQFDASELVLYPNKIQCHLTVLDRALNQSNLISTGIIELQH